jgi:FAD/FMN-containing dehydrogenase
MTTLHGFPVRDIPLFAELTGAEWAALEKRLRIRRYREKDVLVREGTPILSGEPALFILLSGQVLVTCRDGGFLRVLHPGETFGLLSLADGAPRAATCLAASRVTVAVMERGALEELRATDERLTCALELGVARQLARDLRTVAALLQASAHRPAREPTPPARTEVESFTRSQRATPELHRPRSADELAELFHRAHHQGRRLVLRGAGLSFDGQSVDDDLALSLEAMDHLAIDPLSGHFTAGPGVTWGEVCTRLAPHGWVMPAAVTTSSATVGGTLSSNSLSRFSPIFGKEGRAVLSIDLLTPDGERRTCTRTESPDLFYAAIGGLGGVGVVVSATYAAHPVPTPTRVRSHVRRHPSIEGLGALLGPSALHGEKTAYGIFSVGEDKVRGLVISSEYCAAERLRPMLPHEPEHRVRVPLEMAVNRWHALSSLFWAFTHDIYMRGADTRPFVDDLLGYTFFMEGHLRAKRAADRLGLPFEVMQQTFVVPEAADLARFLATGLARLRADGIPLALLDVLWLPEDEPFCLSSSRGLAGYAVTFSFEGPFSVPHLRKALEALSKEVLAIGGRTHLGKNVCADPEDLAAMYQSGLTDYAAVKDRVDPHGMLQSRFLRRCFPSLGDTARRRTAA